MRTSRQFRITTYQVMSWMATLLLFTLKCGVIQTVVFPPLMLEGRNKAFAQSVEARFAAADHTDDHQAAFQNTPKSFSGGDLITRQSVVNVGNPEPGVQAADMITVSTTFTPNHVYNLVEVFQEGAEITLTAAGMDDARFVGWQGAGCTSTNPCTLTMDQDHTVTARFRDCPRVLWPFCRR